MQRNKLVKVVLGLVLTLFLIPQVTPAHAASTALGNFYASCGDFSVDLATTGAINEDGQGNDLMRYQVTDNANHILYVENVTRPVGVTLGSEVIDMKYFPNATPTANPIRFSVLSVDSNGNEVGEVAAMTYDASCLPASNEASRSGVYPIPALANGTMTATAALWEYPDQNRLSLVAETGKSYDVVYRRPDNSWYAIWVGGNDLVWVPASVISVTGQQPTIPPTQVDGSGLSSGQNEALATTISLTSLDVAGQPSGATVTTSPVRLHVAPDANSVVIDAIPAQTVITVQARSVDSFFVEVTYNGEVGWISSLYTNLSAANLLSFPIGQ